MDGVLAKRRKTYTFALKDQREMEKKGYKNVSIAEIYDEKGFYNR